MGMTKRPARVPYRVMLDADLMAGLKRLQVRTDATIAATIRRAIRNHLIKQGELPKRSPEKRGTRS